MFLHNLASLGKSSIFAAIPLSLGFPPDLAEAVGESRRNELDAPGEDGRLRRNDLVVELVFMPSAYRGHPRATTIFSCPSRIPMGWQ